MNLKIDFNPSIWLALQKSTVIFEKDMSFELLIAIIIRLVERIVKLWFGFKIQADLPVF